MATRTETAAPARFETWAVVEIMGHQRTAGFVTVEEIAGLAFLRIDTPGSNGSVHTEYVGPRSIHRLRPCTEAVARMVAVAESNSPIHMWDVPDDWRPKMIDTDADAAGDIS